MALLRIARERFVGSSRRANLNGASAEVDNRASCSLKIQAHVLVWWLGAWRGRLLIQHHDPANRGAKVRCCSSIAAAGPLEPARRSARNRRRATTRLRRAWNGGFSSPNCVGVTQITGHSRQGAIHATGAPLISGALPVSTRLHDAVIHHRGGWFFSPISLPIFLMREPIGQRCIAGAGRSSGS